MKFFSSSPNSQPLWIVLFIAGILTALSFINWPQSFKGVDMLSEVKKSSAPEQSSISLKADSIKNPLKETVIVPTTDTLLIKFLSALHQQKKSGKKLRIAWFGDSMIEGDLVTDDFRKMMQAAYGGNGVGFVDINSNVAQFRQSINHSFSKDWTEYNFVNKAPVGEKLGISGRVFISGSGSWVKYVASKSYDAFTDARLLLGKCNQSITVQADSISLTLEADSTEVMHELQVHEGSSVKKITMNFPHEGCHCFGTYFDGGSGVYVDNFAFRGNSGIPLTSISANQLRTIAAKENYKLIILSYGLNVVAHNTKKYDWYQRSFAITLQHIKEAFPDASILLMSVGDKSYRKNGVYETEPDIPIFVEIQKKLAADAGIAYWSLYDAMGGFNSMKKWVEEKPRLANTDYTHPNFAGAKKIAQLFYNYLMKEMKLYDASVKQNELTTANAH